MIRSLCGVAFSAVVFIQASSARDKGAVATRAQRTWPPRMDYCA